MRSFKNSYKSCGSDLLKTGNQDYNFKRKTDNIADKSVQVCMKMEVVQLPVCIQSL